MKVLSAALATLALLVGGLTTAGPATAAPYPHSVPTTCKVIPKPKNATVRAGKRPAVVFKIAAGNAQPITKVKVKAIRIKTTTKPRKVMWKTVRHYRGYRTIWLLKRLPVGKYKIKFRTSFGEESVYKQCGTRYVLTSKKS